MYFQTGVRTFKITDNTLECIQKLLARALFRDRDLCSRFSLFCVTGSVTSASTGWFCSFWQTLANRTSKNGLRMRTRHQQTLYFIFNLFSNKLRKKKKSTWEKFSLTFSKILKNPCFFVLFPKVWDNFTKMFLFWNLVFGKTALQTVTAILENFFSAFLEHLRSW